MDKTSTYDFLLYWYIRTNNQLKKKYFISRYLGPFLLENMPILAILTILTPTAGQPITVQGLVVEAYFLLIMGPCALDNP
jgi:hypothetical protein